MLKISTVSLFPLSLVEASVEYRIYSSRRRIESKHNLSSTDRYDIFNCAFEFGQTCRFTSRPTPHITRQMILRKEKRREKESKKKSVGGTTNKSKEKIFSTMIHFVFAFANFNKHINERRHHFFHIILFAFHCETSGKGRGERKKKERETRTNERRERSKKKKEQIEIKKINERKEWTGDKRKK